MDVDASSSSTVAGAAAPDTRQHRLELVGSAAAGIAHDLNNQFTLILNHLALSDVESARDAVSRCAALTSGLLAYCRGQAATLKAIDPAVVVRRFVARLVLPSDIALHVDLTHDAALVLGDETAIERALDNLIRNACAAINNDGQIRIAVRGAEIEVADCGPGIAPENLRRIFEPFFSTGGSGLGLAIVRDIMRTQGGSVTVASEPGAGATFTLRFRTVRETA